MIFRDPEFVDMLIAKGFVPFAYGAEGDEHSYDPVCFDLRGAEPADDSPVVRFDHESILSFSELGNSRFLWPSFEALMAETVADAGGP